MINELTIEYINSLKQLFKLKSDSITVQLIKLALPVIASTFMSMAYNFINMVWVGRLGSSAVAAVGTAGLYLHLGWAVSSLVTTGTGIKISHAAGKKDIRLIKSYVKSGMAAITIMSFIYAAALLSGRNLLIGFFMLGDPSVENQAIEYLVIGSITLIFSFRNFFYASIFTGYGDTRTPFRINTAGLITNALLDPILIFTAGWGIKGAAVATLISQILVAFLYQSSLRKTPELRPYEKISTQNTNSSPAPSSRSNRDLRLEKRRENSEVPRLLGEGFRVRSFSRLYSTIFNNNVLRTTKELIPNPFSYKEKGNTGKAVPMGKVPRLLSYRTGISDLKREGANCKGSLLVPELSHSPLQPGTILFRKVLLKQIIGLSISPALQRIIFTVIAIIMARIISEWGAAAIAVQKVGVQIEAISFMTVSGFSTALSTLSGQAFGAKDYGKQRESFSAGISLSIIVGIIASLLFILFPGQLFSIFINDPKSLSMGKDYLVILGYSQVFSCIEAAATGAFYGWGRTNIPAVISISLTALRIPAALLLVNVLKTGLNGIWWSISVSSIGKGLVLSVLFVILLKTFLKNQTEVSYEK